jgi:dephospho-CoA kinase
VEKNKLLIAFVGMPGSGKTEATAYLHSKGIPFVRFGDITDEGLKKQGVVRTPESEQTFRENIRKELGMAAYAIKSEPKITEAFEQYATVALDGLRSWEEYRYLKDRFPHLVLIQVYAKPRIRYDRLDRRKVRSFTPQEARKRDFAELEHLNMGGPIAIADFLIENDDDILEHLHQKIDGVLHQLGENI